MRLLLNHLRRALPQPRRPPDDVAPEPAGKGGPAARTGRGTPPQANRPPTLLEAVSSPEFTWSKVLQYAFLLVVPGVLMMLLLFAGVIAAHRSGVPESWGAVLGPASGGISYLVYRRMGR